MAALSEIQHTMTVTFVTAFIPPKTLYRSIEVYRRHFDKFAESGAPILLFLESSLLEWSFPSNVRVIPTHLSMEWIPADVKLPAHRTVTKDTQEYFAIQLQKLAWLVEALAYTTTSHLAWLDFGAFHMMKDPDNCSHLLRQIAISDFPSHRILAPGCWQAGTYDWNSVAWRFCGTFLLGHRDLLPPALTRQTELVQTQLPQLTWEINYWSQMDDIFEVYYASHDDSLLSRVMVFVQRHQGVST